MPRYYLPLIALTLLHVALGQVTFDLEQSLTTVRQETEEVPPTSNLRQGYDFSWGGHDYYLGWDDGHTWEGSRSVLSLYKPVWHD